MSEMIEIHRQLKLELSQVMEKKKNLSAFCDSNFFHSGLTEEHQHQILRQLNILFEYALNLNNQIQIIEEAEND